MTSEIAPQVNTNNNYVVVEDKCPSWQHMTSWGVWGAPEYCPEGSYAKGFHLRVGAVECR